MSPFSAEFLGTALLIVLGDGVVANVALARTHGHGGGLMAITAGWAAAVFVAVYAVASTSGAHLNPAVTLALALRGKFLWQDVPSYMCAQLLGAFVGATIVWLAYRRQFDATADPATVRGVFCTAPAIRDLGSNFLTEAIATCVFVLGVLQIAAPTHGLGALDALPVALLVLAIGLSLGGPTGYAINPARDLGPRLAHAILPLRGKGDSDWGYAWVPIAGPLVGATAAALLHGALFGG
ncbi:MIP/aquaporin family protein [Nannocystis bainbridge]|uniref:Aquaporin family protein n=1 Tax=Nannocystis bainbridge TaxID=2995303 RepID=A0ABT5DS95_9BACT|nr:MIP/aquaporin family protein [Nannocystis bainbridge]MDC0716505.1 aquaporin family protein [Nannocystis bainbridge]